MKRSEITFFVCIDKEPTFESLTHAIELNVVFEWRKKKIHFLPSLLAFAFRIYDRHFSASDRLFRTVFCCSPLMAYPVGNRITRTNLHCTFFCSNKWLKMDIRFWGYLQKQSKNRYANPCPINTKYDDIGNVWTVLHLHRSMNTLR